MKRNCYETERGLATHSDDNLLTAAKDGEHQAFIELSRRCSPMIFRILVRITKNEEDAEDAMQETLMRAFTHLKSFDGRSSFSTWLTRIAINSALMTLRKGRKHHEISFDAFLEKDNGTCMQYVDSGPNPEAVYVQTERHRRLQEAIQHLPPVLLECIEIQHSNDSSLQEIANITGVSLSATKSRLLRARRKIFTYLNRQNPLHNIRKDGGSIPQGA